MKKASTLIRPGSWKSVFAVLFAWCLVGTLHAQTTVVMDLSNDTGDYPNGVYSPCDHAGNVSFSPDPSITYVDFSGAGGLYDDNINGDGFEEYFWTFCPDDPAGKVQLNFTEFDIADGDGFRIYAGDCADAQASIAAGNAAADAANTGFFGTAGILVSGNSVGSMGFSNPTYVAGPGVTPAEVGVIFGAGWVAAGCEIDNGCLTVGFFGNDDGNKGTGWEFTVTELTNTPAINECPSYAGMATCGGTAAVTILAPPLNACASAGIAAGVYTIDVTVDGIPAAINDVANLTAGIHTITYTLDGSGVSLSCDFTIADAADLVCNDHVNISLGADCGTALSPDDIVESDATPAYPLTITINGGTHTSTGAAVPFPGLILSAGTHTYTLRDDCGNVCTGSISLADLQGPVCPGTTVEFMPCGAPIAVVTPTFSDCSGVAETSYDDAVFGSCTEFTTAERDILFAAGYGEMTWWVETAPGSGVWQIPAVQNGTELVESVTIRSWKAVDGNGNTTEGCNQIYVGVRPDELNSPIATITVGCDAGTSPAELLAAEHPAVPSFSITLPANFSPLTGSGASTTTVSDFVLPGGHSTCGWITNYTDVEVEACGNAKKIIRTWTWLDWCSDSPAVLPTTGPFTQIIEVVDNVAPELDGGPAPMTRTVGHFECEADITIGSAVWNDGCGEVVSYRTEIREVRSDGSVGRILWSNNENGGSFANIALGNYFVRYYATDACGNETSTLEGGVDRETWDPIPHNVYTTTLAVIDDVLPQPQCDDRINISLGSDWGRIAVADVDEGSYDNCGITSMGISLSESGPFEDVIEITCDNIHELLKVYLEVQDGSGNSNKCWGNVVVEDKIAPICSAPADMSMTCDEAHLDALLTASDDELNALFGGAAVCSDNIEECNNITISQSVEYNESGCGNATITRTMIATDLWGHESAPVTQTISLTYNANWKVTFPASGTVTCSEAADGAFGSAASADDILTSIGFCDRLSVNVDEQVFNGSSDACVKVVRTYTVWNECGTPGVVYNANTQGVTMVENGDTDAQQIVYTQTISADITEGPEIQLDPIDTNIYGSATKDGNTVCTDPKVITLWADDCLGFGVPDGNITWTLSGASGDITGTGPSIAFDAAPGTYNLEVWASDGCGNSNGLETSLTFVDAKAPGIWLYTTLSTEIMPANGMIDIWANDFIGAIVDCDDYTTGIWHQSMGDAPASCSDVAALGQNAVFDCNYVGTQIVRIYAMDASGNCDYVETALVIQDNGNACGGGDVVVEEEQVAGKITNPDGQFVEVVDVSVNGSMSSAMTTGNSGAYAFTVPTGGDYTITPEKDINHLNGVSTFDLVLISKHILNIQNFTSPYEYIAADINQSGTITAFDMVQLRQLILNINTEFPNNTSWRFVDAAHTFGATPLTENFNEFVSINNIATDQLAVDFIAVKIGDINGSALASSLVTAEARNANGTLVLTTEDRQIAKGEQVSVSFTAADIASVDGYQFTMNYSGLELNQVVEGVAKAANFNNVRNALVTSWNGQATATDVLFTTEFTATADGLLSELISVSSDVTAAEAYNTAGELLDVAIEFTTTSVANFELLQNTPNPFNAETVIGFNLPTAGSATLKVMDIQGKVLKAITGDYTKGYNQISLSAKELGATGVLSYQLESADNVVTKKMIIID